MPRNPLFATKSFAALLAEESDEGRTSCRFKEGPEKAFRKQDIQLKTSSAKDEESLELQLIENEVATFIKQGFDEKFGSNWNVIVGRNFGSHLSCTEHVQLSIAKISVIIFKIEMFPPPSPRHQQYSIHKEPSQEENHSNPLKVKFC